MTRNDKITWNRIISLREYAQEIESALKNKFGKEYRIQFGMGLIFNKHTTYSSYFSAIISDMNSIISYLMIGKKPTTENLQLMNIILKTCNKIVKQHRFAISMKTPNAQDWQYINKETI